MTLAANTAGPYLATIRRVVPAISTWAPLAGLAAWLALVAARGPLAADAATFAELVVAFAPLVAVPLVLPATVAEDRRGGPGPARRRRLIACVHLVGAASVWLGAALVPTGGALARALAGVWLAAAAALALHGLARLVGRSRLHAPELALDLSLVFLAGGAVWLLVYRGELVLGGFGGLSALLTAAHFHAAGFGTLALTGLLGRGLADAGAARARRVYALVAPLLMLAFPLLAAGIGAAARPLELAGAGLYALALPLLAGLQVAAAVALRGRPLAWRLLLVASSLALLVGAGFAARFAAQGFYGAAIPIPTMLRWHGAVNLIGFLGLGLLAWSRLRPPPLAGPAGAPFSRLRGRGRIGADFLERHAPGLGPPPRGLVDDLAVFDRPGFAAAAVHPAVRRFYERTDRHALAVAPRWRAPFRLAGRVWHALARRVGQMALPLAASATMPSRIAAVDADRDGRPGVRGWVRTLGEAGPPVYVAAYATHRDPDGQTYMNIAFPLPHANLASLLRVDHDPARPGGLSLTTCSMGQDDRGDQGVFVVTARGALRVPMNETIWVWPAGPQPDAPLRARHRVWWCGLVCIELDYEITAA
jgi:hypothetical protein